VRRTGAAGRRLKPRLGADGRDVRPEPDWDAACGGRTRRRILLPRCL